MYEHSFQVRIYSVFSCAFRFVDTFTGRSPISSNLHVKLIGSNEKPVAKGDWYVCSNLTKGSYRLLIESQLYISQAIDFEITDTRGNGHSEEQIILLTPSTIYPFRQGDTLIRGGIREPSGLPAGGIPITAILHLQQGLAVKLSEDASVSSKQISLYCPTARVSFPDTFCAEVDGIRYIIQISEMDKGKIASLTKPLSKFLPKGTILHPYYQTKSNDRGDYVFALSPKWSKACSKVDILVHTNDLTGAWTIAIEDGHVHSAGMQQLVHV